MFAYPVRRPVEYGGGIPVVGPSRPEGQAHGFVQPLEGSGGLLQPGADIGAGPFPGVLSGLGRHQGTHLPQGPLGQQHKNNRGGKHLIEQGNVQPILPAPQHRQGVGEHVGNCRRQPSLPVESPGHNTGQGVGHGVEGHAPCGQIHTQAHCHAHRSSHTDAAPAGSSHHRHRRCQPSGGQLAGQHQVGQGEQQGTCQDQQAHRLP